ncbi:MAG: hypothetical protein E6K72_07030 [Candidatus Eisenbacteria bacterium]|uniref:YncE family protein n=1 Tax=Eiseniibacteriota bacterium TaxID=2212470 RepID=A0A538SUC7_UNCEI|nr:MAG: hypothetical protein E6K72_07030 [Candidatus Eisenbacteria bacterium]
MTSALYRHVLREIPVPNAILAGGIAIDPRRERLVLTTKNLGMVSVDLDSTEIVTTLSSQVGGAGVAVTPGGNRVLAVAPAPDAGTILFADPLGPSGSVVVGGDARDIKISPDGATALVTNAGLGRLQVLDVTQSTPRLVANVATGSAPVAVGVSGGGTDVAVANFAGRTIGFYHVVSTATPVRATPPIAMTGDAVAVAVTGGTLPSGTVVETGAASGAALHVVPSAAAFRVPAVEPASTTVTLISDGVRSLGLPFEVVEPIPTLDPRPTGITLDPVDADCGAGPVDGALRILRLSPDGKLIAVSREGPSCARVDVYQAAPGGATALGARLVDGASLPGATALRDLAFTPDGKKLWVATDAEGLFEVDVDTQSGGFGSVLPFGGATVGSARALAADPMGRYVVAAVDVTPGVHRIQLWSPGRTLSTSVDLPGPVHALAATPDGRYAIAGGEGRAYVVDLASPALVASTPLHTNVPHDVVT